MKQAASAADQAHAKYKRRHRNDALQVCQRASAADLALLVDRIEMRNGRPQIYGSEITMKDGTYVIYEIRDEANVNKRRADVGLQPLEEYVKRWNIHYTPVGK